MSNTNNNNWLGGLLLIKLAYACALAAAYFSYIYLFENQGILWGTFWADVAATSAIFAFSLAFRNASFYDAYWSVAPVPIVLFWWMASERTWTDTPQLLAFIAVCVWSIRLTLNWWRGWTGLAHEDWRYGDLRQKTGSFYPIVNFLGIHLFPTILVYLGCLPLFVLYFCCDAQASYWDWIGFSISISGAVLELIADEQQRIFKQQNPDPQAFVQTGVWKYSRHPNYLGEFLFWFGLFFFMFDIGWDLMFDHYWAWLGWISMFGLFWFISIPMMEARMVAKRPLYKNYQASTSRFFFWFTKS